MIEDTLCPKCGAKMISRANRNTGQRFWGCSRYPECKGTRNTDGEAPKEKDDEESESKLPSDRQRENDKFRFGR